ncbi:MAG: TlpA family protein disulfide reductase [Actinomycetota bacterium]|nr:TlpA family protein disulfide reductase [Actinomycetota bacterium]
MLVGHWARAALAACALLVLSGCGNGAAGGSTAGAREHHRTSLAPIHSRGVEPCRELTTAASPTPDPAFLSLRLPCLTTRGSVELATLGGKPTIVNLWASWCGPCRQEMPALQAAYHRHRVAVQFVGINIRDDPKGAAQFLTQVGVTYPQLVDQAGTILADLRVPGLPVTIVLGPGGRIIARHIGALTASGIEKLIQDARA